LCRDAQIGKTSGTSGCDAACESGSGQGSEVKQWTRAQRNGRVDEEDGDREERSCASPGAVRYQLDIFSMGRKVRSILYYLFSTLLVFCIVTCLPRLPGIVRDFYHVVHFSPSNGVRVVRSRCEVPSRSRISP